MGQGRIRARVSPRAVLCLLLVAPGCATVTGGSGAQTIKIASTPPGAAVVVDGRSCGPTPAEVKLDHKTEHQVQLSYPGHETAQVTLKPSLNPWVFGNILIGGVLGLAIDVCTDSVYELSPDTVNVKLRPQGEPRYEMRHGGIGP